MLLISTAGDRQTSQTPRCLFSITRKIKSRAMSDKHFDRTCSTLSTASKQKEQQRLSSASIFNTQWRKRKSAHKQCYCHLRPHQVYSPCDFFFLFRWRKSCVWHSVLREQMRLSPSPGWSWSLSLPLSHPPSPLSLSPYKHTRSHMKTFLLL